MKRLMVLVLFPILLLSGCHQAKKLSESERIQSYIEKLCSPQFGGRQGGTEGNILAESWLQDQLKAMGIAPLFDEYGQKFSVIANLHDFSRMTVFYEDEVSEDLVYGRDFFIAFSTQSFATVIQKIDENYVFSENIDELSSLKKEILFSKRESFENHVYSFSNGRILIQLSPKLYDILERGFSRIELEHNVTPQQMELSNIAGVIKGKRSDQCLVLSAHFDHVGNAEGILFAGALDNASGCSAILNLAEKLAAHYREALPEYDIVITFFNGEEMNLVGSAYFVEALMSQYTHIVNINLDCLGKKDEENLYKLGGGGSKDLVTALAPYLREQGIHFDAEDGVITSDAISFNIKDIPTVGLIVENISPPAHSPLDTPEKIDCDHIAALTEGIYRFILETDKIDFTFVAPTGSDQEDAMDKAWAELGKTFTEHFNRNVAEIISGEKEAFDTDLFNDSFVQGTFTVTEWEAAGHEISGPTSFGDYTLFFIGSDFSGMVVNYFYLDPLAGEYIQIFNGNNESVLRNYNTKAMEGEDRFRFAEHQGRSLRGFAVTKDKTTLYAMVGEKISVNLIPGILKTSASVYSTDPVTDERILEIIKTADIDALIDNWKRPA